MKISVVQAFIAVVVGGTAVAHDHHAQLLERVITVHVDAVPLEVALKEIGVQAQVKFVYSGSQLDLLERVTVVAEEEALGVVLERLFFGRDIAFRVYEREASITLRRERRKVPVEKSEAEVQGLPGRGVITVTGRVTDAVTHSGMAGVNVLVKGSTRGTTTDGEGNYRLEVEDDGVLVFSFIGYRSVEEVIRGRAVVDVALAEDISSLDEVVVRAGYWDLKKKEQTGNIARVSAEDISRSPVSNPLQALQGRMAGVFIQQTTGAAGGGFAIQIRGQNSLRNLSTNSGNHPLYLVDGVPFTPSVVGSTSLGNSITPQASPLSAIHPNDIESIEVLKDADATAIYGSRGANGVVLITTKRSQGRGTNVEASFSRGVSQVAHRVDLLTSQEYNVMRREAFRNDASEHLLVPANAALYADVLVWDTTRYTDWQREFLGGLAHTVQGETSLSGGDEHTRFRVGGNYYRETAVFPGDFAYRRGSGMFHVNHRSVNRKLQVNASGAYSVARNELPSLDLTEVAMLLPPVAPPLYDDEGQLNWAGGTWVNPLAGLARAYEAKTQHLLTSWNLSYELAEGLSVKTNLGYTAMQTDQLSTNPIRANSPTSGVVTGTASFGSGKLQTWIVEPQADYRRDLGGGTVTVLVGSTWQQNVQEAQTLSASGYTSDALLGNIQSAPSVTVSNASFSEYRYAALFGRVHYNWKDKYLVNFTGRRDGSTRFGPGKQFANFGAVGAAWLFSGEEFVQEALPFVTFGKLRVSYGLTGSDQIGDYQFLNTYSSTPLSYGGVPGLLPTRLVNPDFAWETNRKFETGVEFGFLDDGLRLAVSWFRNLSSNQLVGYPLPRLTGQSSVQYNLDATVENKGWEVELESTLLRRSLLTWRASLNLTVPENRLLKYPNLEASSYASSLEVGKSLYVRKLVHGTGVDAQTGLYTFEDVNNNGVTLFDTPGDLQALTNVSQRFFGGVGSTVSYGGLTASLLFQFVKQTGRTYLSSFNQSPGSASNQPSVVMGRWRQPGDEATIQRFTQSFSRGGNAFSNAVQSDVAFGDASFVRLKSVSVSWDVPRRLVSRVQMKSAKVYVLGQNVVTFTDYLGLDPETQSSRVLPPLRTVTLGLQVKF